jgi:hypothetical protein
MQESWNPIPGIRRSGWRFPSCSFAQLGFHFLKPLVQLLKLLLDLGLFLRFLGAAHILHDAAHLVHHLQHVFLLRRGQLTRL